MTEKELGQMHYLNREIEKLNEELSWMECKSMIKSPLLTGMPFGTGVSDKTADYAVRMEEIRELKCTHDFGHNNSLNPPVYGHRTIRNP